MVALVDVVAQVELEATVWVAVVGALDLEALALA